MSESSSFMNALIRGDVREDDNSDSREQGEQADSIGGKSDGGAGSERANTGARDMNAWLREAVQESRGQGA